MTRYCLEASLDQPLGGYARGFADGYKMATANPRLRGAEPPLVGSAWRGRHGDAQRVPRGVPAACPRASPGHADRQPQRDGGTQRRLGEGAAGGGGVSYLPGFLSRRQCGCMVAILIVAVLALMTLAFFVGRWTA